MCLGFLLIYGAHHWILPFISEYITTSHCHQPFGIDGMLFLWYCLFVGLPLHIVPFVAVFTWPVAYRSFKQQQYPPIGQKVFAKTEIVFGSKAKLKALVILIPTVILLSMAVWGYCQVDKMPLDKSNLDHSVCQSE